MIVTLLHKQMKNFQQQENLLAPLLALEDNKYCADCTASTPTWASLDFGVFVCSDCSGAHRGLGPTVTRVRSTKLDLWQEQWLQNMKIGNRQLNLYWEGNVETAKLKKPKNASNLSDHNRFVVDKYVKKKFVNDQNQADPLKKYKNGHYLADEQTLPTPPQAQETQNCGAQRDHNLKAFNLLDDENLAHQVHKQPINQANNIEKDMEKVSNRSECDDEEFDDFVQAAPVVQSKVQQINFDQLIKAPYLNSAPENHPTTHHHHNLPHHPLHNNFYQPQSYNNIHLHQHNPFAYHQPTNYNQHNPYIGYVPHHGNSQWAAQSHGYPLSHGVQNYQNMGNHSNFTLN